MPSISSELLNELSWCHGRESAGMRGWVRKMVRLTPFSDPILVAREQTRDYEAKGYAVACIGSVAVVGALRCMSTIPPSPQAMQASQTSPSSHDRSEVFGRLILDLRWQAANRGVELFQAIHPTESGLLTDLDRLRGYERGGMYRVARLLQMDCKPIEPLALSGALDGPITANSKLQFRPYRELAWSRWCHLIEQTYTGSLDIPGLAGLRSIDNTLAGYADGIPEQKRAWWSVWEAGIPVGCMLVTPVGPSTGELTYLGLVPGARGRGFGAEMLRFVGNWMLDQKRERLVLAVDERNKPAISTYQKFGLRVTISLDAWLAPPFSTDRPHSVPPWGEPRLES
ncbi:MAG: GNAT family N-acetyltransferase [Planctomycetota bacterium]